MRIRWIPASLLLVLAGLCFFVTEGLANQTYVPPDKAELAIASIGLAGDNFTLITVCREADGVRIEIAKTARIVGDTPLHVTYVKEIMAPDQYDELTRPLAFINLEQLQGTAIHDLVNQRRGRVSFRTCGGHTSYRLRLTWAGSMLTKTISLDLSGLGDDEIGWLEGHPAVDLLKFEQWMAQLADGPPTQEISLDKTRLESIFRSTDEGLWLSKARERLSRFIELYKQQPVGKPRVVMFSEEEAVLRVEPIYPPMARAAWVQGTVEVEVLVAEDGQVLDAEVISGHPYLRLAALDIARFWKFKPAAFRRPLIVRFDFRYE
ncbi:MAG: energy transducer TonB [Candidatus Caldarchaeum sp.]